MVHAGGKVLAKGCIGRETCLPEDLLREVADERGVGSKNAATSLAALHAAVADANACK